MRYHVIERFRDIYPVKTMCEVFEVTHDRYYARHRMRKKTPKDQ